MIQAANWKAIGQARWYDCKLGKMNDKTLARLVGTTQGKIRYRRLLFGIPAWTVELLIVPFRDLVGIESDRHIAKLSGASVSSVTKYREALGIPPKPKPEAIELPPSAIPANHPVKPYRTLLGLVCDDDIAKLAGCTTGSVRALRELLNVEPPPPVADAQTSEPIPEYQGPWLGYESLFGTMSTAKISRAVGVPILFVERWQTFLGAKAYQRVSRVAKYEHLLGIVPHSVLAKLAGVTAARVAEIHKRKMER